VSDGDFNPQTYFWKHIRIRQLIPE